MVRSFSLLPARRESFKTGSTEGPFFSEGKAACDSCVSLQICNEGKIGIF
jgi:hypothetical protein